MKPLSSLAFALLVVAGCHRSSTPPAPMAPSSPTVSTASVRAPVGAHQDTQPSARAADNQQGIPAVTFGVAMTSPTHGLAEATFAAGCFWCVESSFEGVRGVRAVFSGYTGGPEQRPTYEQVCDHATGHAEAVRVIYDPSVVTYPQLLAVFWRIHDPTTPDRSFYDQGRQYRSAIYVHNAEQRAQAEASKRALETARTYSQRIVTEISDAAAFWPAEDYHQDYHHTHPEQYMSYRRGSGRDAYIEQTWGRGALEVAQRHE
jgi:methionine-S-sulfoxide reductase